MYLPKSKYTGPLYTPEGLYVYEDGTPFSGAYFVTYKNEAYEGKFPAEAGSRIKLKVTYLAEQAIDNALAAEGFYPQPTSADYTRGTFQRYYIQDIRNRNIKEVSSIGFKTAKKLPIYRAVEITWTLSGPVADSKINSYLVIGAENKNRQAVQDATAQIRDLGRFITDFAEFVK